MPKQKTKSSAKKRYWIDFSSPEVLARNDDEAYEIGEKLIEDGEVEVCGVEPVDPDDAFCYRVED